MLIIGKSRFLEPKSITVENFKSIRRKQHMDIAPITILSGANSSGKSSFMQPLMILRQTHQSSFDPGGLLLNGPDFTVDSFADILSHDTSRTKRKDFTLGIEFRNGQYIELTYAKRRNRRVEANEIVYRFKDKEARISVNMGSAELRREVGIISSIVSENSDSYRQFSYREPGEDYRLQYDRGLLELSRVYKSDNISFFFTEMLLGQEVASLAYRMIHLPALRGNPLRSYLRTASKGPFTGSFDVYIASIIWNWKNNKSPKLRDLNDSLRKLKLTSQVDTKLHKDTNIELKVGRLSEAKEIARNNLYRDTVNIADVGFGVSQVLPVLVALLAATRDTVVYIEQPEIHLHPKAQYILASILQEAFKRNVKMIIETHSPLLLLGLQTLIAEGKLGKNDVALHWFSRDEEGFTSITKANLDDKGRFGDWPVDFGHVELSAQKKYLEEVYKEFKE